MFRIAVYNRLKRFYFHAIRNGLSSEKASDLALKQTREEFFKNPQDYIPGKQPEEAEDIWLEITPDLYAFVATLVNIPIDRSRLPLSPDTTENPDALKDAAVEEIQKKGTAEEMMALLERHYQLDEYTRQELWGDVLEFNIRWELYLKSLSNPNP